MPTIEVTNHTTGFKMAGQETKRNCNIIITEISESILGSDAVQCPKPEPDGRCGCYVTIIVR